MTKQGRLEFDGYVTHANQGGLVPVTLDHNASDAGEGLWQCTLPWDARGTGRSCSCGHVVVAQLPASRLCPP